MVKAELHYLKCQDDNCAMAYCVDRRESRAKISKLEGDVHYLAGVVNTIRCMAAGPSWNTMNNIWHKVKDALSPEKIHSFDKLVSRFVTGDPHE